MFNKDLPEVQAYVKEQLQEQAIAIADRMLMTYPIGKTTESVMYVTGLSKEMVEKVFDKCSWKFNYKRNYPKGYVVGQVKIVRNMIKNGNTDAKDLERFLHMDPVKAKQWEKDPDKAAITELLFHHCDIYRIMDAFSMTEEKVREQMPDCQERRNYQPVFKPVSVTDEEAEEAYLGKNIFD